MNKLSKLEASLALPSSLMPFSPSWTGANEVTIWVKRDDMIHPIMSGNKWRKLAYTLKTTKPNAMVSFGGGFSNHLHALGYASYQLGIPLTAIVRGNYSASPSPMINDLMNWNVDIEYVDRITYQKRNVPDYLLQLQQRYNDALIIPEGGSQQSALHGIGEMVEEITIPFDVIMAPVASGATLAGIINKLSNTQQALGIGVLKGENYLESLVSQFISDKCSAWSIDHRFHLGGYAKVPSELRTFCDEFNTAMSFTIEPVYSGKLFWALKQLLKESYFPKGSNIIVLHTGGLQGAR
ncbi:pyridoxal-phosphate dependent enzyme [Alteromonas sp. McT4-15]|uniref:1-aminocyclopropane-1-carboxylate deaminase/D-cysteine desulfhydrase n=1 Tax=Alteromonas sp. McT4-15 TaxID=2881256 RepID=UPI001CF88ABC|nr:pyridoxal-phosphate dependent enzyme [Alteromonas sp. McT4-15]MCB4435180.1 pyridoxal-phosphate dependent enzyme [Alteromonas sp. McT4-15]